MHLQSRSSGLALTALATFALSLSCGNSGGSPSDGGAPPAGAGGASGSATTGGSTNAGTTGASGTTGVGGTAGTTSTGGSGGTTSTGGSSGEGGGNPAGMGGTSGGGAGGAPGTGGGGTAGTGAAAGSGGAAGGGTMPSAGCGKAAGIMSGRASIDVAGKMREYIVAIPSNYDQNRPHKLIFGWHPWGGSAQQIAQQGYFGLSSVINGQAILVAPEGQNFDRNGMMGLGWGNANGEDVAFAHAMMDRFTAQLCIDQNRMFSTGFSFGAMFSFTFGCTANSRMRAIAPMAGNTQTSGGCENSTRSVATMSFIGVDDSLLMGHRSAVQIFVERNGCMTQTMPAQPSWCDGLASQYQPCSCVQYQGCSTGYPVVECEYKAGHIFAPSAGATLWNFFSQF